MIVGNGRYASAEAVLQLARQVVDRPLYLHVRWMPKLHTSPDSDVEGFQTTQTVTVNERPARLVRATQ